MKKEKKIYKADKKLLKRIGLALVAFIVILLIAILLKNYGEIFYLKTWKSYNSKEFGFSYELPRAYEKIENSDEDRFGLNSSAFMSEFSVEIKEEYVAQKPTVIYNGGNILNGISLNIQCLKTPRIDESLEEIARNYYATVQMIYGDKYNVSGQKTEKVTVLGGEGIKSEILLVKGEKNKKLVTYLVPTDDIELTLTFLSDAEKIDTNMEEINKIISKIK